MRGLGGLGCQLDARYRVPDRKPFLEHSTVPLCGKAMPAGTKVLTDGAVGSEKALGVAR
jgi:hypothetical protein